MEKLPELGLNSGPQGPEPRTQQLHHTAHTHTYIHTHYITCTHTHTHTSIRLNTVHAKVYTNTVHTFTLKTTIVVENENTHYTCMWFLEYTLHMHVVSGIHITHACGFWNTSYPIAISLLNDNLKHLITNQLIIYHNRRAEPLVNSLIEVSSYSF